MSDDILNLEEGHEPPVERIRDADSARAILSTLRDEDSLSSQKRAMIQGLIDGNPPYSEKDLERSGQKDRVNVNWGHAGAKIDEACIPYFDMLTSVERVAQIRTNYGTPLQQSLWSDIIEEEFTLLVNRDKSRLIEHQLAQKYMVTFGMGFLYFSNSLDWRVRNIPPANVFIPKKAHINPDRWDYCFINDEYTTTELYAHIRNTENGERLGWNIENAREAIILANIDEEDRKRSWEWHQSEIRTNSLHYSSIRSKVIQLSHLFVREFSGRISHYILDRQNPINWLYKKTDCYESFNNAFNLFTNGVSFGEYHSLRGLGKLIYPYAEAMNRVNNSILEGAIVGSATLLRATSSNDVAKLQTIQVGPWRVLPQGVEPVSMSIGNALQQSMTVAGFFQSQETDTTSGFTPTIIYNRDRRQTNQELNTAQENRDILTNYRAESYMQQLDVHYEETYRRASNLNLVEEDPGGKEALLFQRKCQERGVPKAALKSVVSVRATRTIGQGSASGRQQAMGQIAQFIPMLPEDKRIIVIRDSIAAIGGPQFVEKYAPQLNNEPTGNDASIASLENNAFLSGGSVILDRNQNHYIHAQIHIQQFFSWIEQIQGGQLDPRQVLSALQVGGPHLMVHLEYIQRDPSRKAQFDELNRQTAELMKITDQIAQMAAELDEAEQMQEQGPATPEMMVAQNRIQLDQAKAQSEMQIKQAKAQQQMAIKDMQSAQKIQLNARQ